MAAANSSSARPKRIFTSNGRSFFDRNIVRDRFSSKREYDERLRKLSELAPSHGQPLVTAYNRRPSRTTSYCDLCRRRIRYARLRDSRKRRRTPPSCLSDPFSRGYEAWARPAFPSDRIRPARLPSRCASHDGPPLLGRPETRCWMRLSFPCRCGSTSPFCLPWRPWFWSPWLLSSFSGRAPTKRRRSQMLRKELLRLLNSPIVFLFSFVCVFPILSGFVESVLAPDETQDQRPRAHCA